MYVLGGLDFDRIERIRLTFCAGKAHMTKEPYFSFLPPGIALLERELRRLKR